MIVLLSGRSLFCQGLSVQLGLMNRPVASVPLSSKIPQMSRTLHRLQPDLLILDALEVRASGFLFIDALRQEEAIATCPILIIASGSFPDEARFIAAAHARGLHVMLEAVSFEELVERVEAIVDQPTPRLAAVAS